MTQLDSVQEFSQVVDANTDVVVFPEKVDGGVYVSDSIRWLGSLEGIATWEEFIDSPSVVKEITKGERVFAQQGFIVRTEPLTLALADAFISLYQREVVAQKGDRLVRVNIEEQTKGKVLANLPVYLIGVYDKDVLRAGLVFYLKGKEALVTVGAKERYNKVKGGFGGVIEKHLLDWCLHHSIVTISHGKSMNPAGIMAKAGVFEFKARYGYSAYPEGGWKTMLILNKAVAEQDLVFVTIGDQGLEYVIITQEGEKDVVRKYQTKNVRKVRVLSSAQWILESQAWLQKKIPMRDAST